MNGMDRYHGQPSRLSRSGFISALFLSVFLCLCLYTGILAANIRNRSEVILNLKREQEYFLSEADVIREAMCTLQKEKKQAEEKEKEETEEETGEAEKTGEEPEEWLGDTEKLTDQLEGSILRITVDGPYPEEVLLTIDPESMKVIDCMMLRSEGDDIP